MLRDFVHVFEDFRAGLFQKMGLPSPFSSVLTLTTWDISAKRPNNIAGTRYCEMSVSYRVQRFNERQCQLQEEQRKEKEAAEIREISSKVESIQQEIRSLFDSPTNHFLTEVQLAEYQSKLISLQDVDVKRLESYTKHLHMMVDLKQSIERAIQKAIHKRHKESIRSIQQHAQSIMDLLQQYYYHYGHEREIGENILKVNAIRWMDESEQACRSFCETVSAMRSKDILKQVDSLTQQCENHRTAILSVSRALIQ